MKAPQKPSQDHQPAPSLEESQKIEWTHWQAIMAGDTPPRFHPDYVPFGYYRWTDRREKTRKDIPVGIYPDAKGNKWVVLGEARPFKFRDAADEAAFGISKFAYFDKAAISFDVYQHWQQHKAWPADQAADAIAASETPREGNGEPHEILAETLKELQAEVKKWFEGIGGAEGPGIQTKEDADRAANFADRFADIEKDADTRRLSLRKPLQEQLDAIQAIWAPIQRDADTAKRWAKNAAAVWLRAENARKLQEAAAAAAEGKAVRMSDVKGAKAGSRGRAISERVHQSYVCDDYAKVRAFLLQDPEFLASPGLASLCGNVANQYLRAGKEVPGARLENVVTVA